MSSKIVLGSLLGRGGDGDVYYDLTCDDKVVKISMIKEYNFMDVKNNYFNNTSPLLSFLETNQPASYARVYAHEYVGCFIKTVGANIRQRCIVYNYSMEKLNKISLVEEKVFFNLIDSKNFYYAFKIFTRDALNEMLDGLLLGLDFDKNKVMDFYLEALKVPINHKDVHEKNIMKDNQGNYKLIDFDRSELLSYI